MALLVGAASPTRADVTTQLPFSNDSDTWLAVDPVGQHVFVSGGPGTSSIVVLDFNGNIVKTITGEPGASQMAVSLTTNALYVALHDATAISEIDTETLTETARFSTYPFLYPTSLVVGGGKLWFACRDSSGCVASLNLDGSGLASAGLGLRAPVTLASGGTGDHLLAMADSGAEPPTLSVYDVSTGSPVLVKSQLNPPSGGGSFGSVSDMAFDRPDGTNLLIAAGAPYFVAALSSTTFAPSFEYPTGPYPESVAVSPDGNYVAGGVKTGTGFRTDVFLFPTGDTTPVRTWTVGTSEVPDHSLAFSPDGSVLFVVADNYTTGHREFDVLDDIEATTPLVARLTASPNPVLTGDQVTLDASRSHDSLGAIIDYQWDLGSGSFDQDTGSTPTTTTSFSSPGPQPLRVKVTNNGGDSAIASATVDVRRAPPPGPVGVSIDNGDYATNSPHVQLNVVWPAYAVNVLISNDGGFGPDEGTQTKQVAATIPWTLVSAGGERLTQIVYLRFPDSPSPTVTFTDNIILDTLTPTIQAATLVTKPAAAAKGRLTVKRGRLYRVRLRAKEKLSGISQVRFSASRHGGTTLVLTNRRRRGITNLSRALTIRMTAAPKWVRVRSAAGNWSKWHPIR